MPKRVLVVEHSLAVRGISESLLRQNGYEVIAADSAASAREILRDSKVNLLIVASDILDDNGEPFFESLGSDSSTAILPLLVLHDSAAGHDIVYPPEAIINKPFTPRDFLESVAAFGGGEAPASEPAPVSENDLEDAIIDSALGLDKIDVDDAEILEDDTGVYRKQGKNDKTESMIGYDYKMSAEDTTKTTKKKIDAINVPPEQPDTPAEQDQADKKSPEKEKEREFLGKPDQPLKNKSLESLSESSKIEIVDDQYGIASSPDISAKDVDADSGAGHDYDWFLKELQKEEQTETPPSKKTKKSETKTSPPAGTTQQSPMPSEAPQAERSAQKQPTTESHTEAVDKFISEFKKEMERITSDPETDSEATKAKIEVTNIAPPDSTKATSETGIKWEEGLDGATPEDIRGLSRQLIDTIAGHIAEKIAARLDEDIIYHLIKDSIDNVLQRPPKEKSRRK
jgi:DNA-binding response OmpR family regulator